MFSLSQRAKIALVSTLLLIAACDSGSNSVESAVTVTPAAPAPPVLMAPELMPSPAPVTDNIVSVNVSASETVTQTNIAAAPARQAATSSNYQATNIVETIVDERSSSQRYSAASTIQLVYGAG